LHSSHVVEVTGPSRTVYFAGQLGIDKSGKMGANAREQMEIAFGNVKAALDSVGASFSDIVKLNTYIWTLAPTSRITARCVTNTSTRRRRRQAPRSGCLNWRVPAPCLRLRRLLSCRQSDLVHPNAP
jgi:enamine deaminase RidA (YjgF/YER057c/UK114 family)